MTRRDIGPTTVETVERELVLERVFDAPVELVWRAFTEAERVERWWGANGTTTTVAHMDVWPGGTYRYLNHGPDGDAPFIGEYREVVPNERLVHTYVFDVDGLRDHVSVVTTTFEDLDGRTRVVSRTEFPSPEDLAGALEFGMVDGAVETWDRLAEELARG